MRFNFGFFGTQEHRVFNYKPRYYDPEKEELRQKFGKVDGRMDSKAGNADGGESGKAEHKYVPGSIVKGSLRDGNYQEQHGHGGRLQRILGVVAMILMFVVMFLIIKWWPYIVAGLQ